MPLVTSVSFFTATNTAGIICEATVFRDVAEAVPNSAYGSGYSTPLSEREDRIEISNFLHIASSLTANLGEHESPCDKSAECR